MPQPSAKPLAGIRVVTLAEQYPGPYATLLLADLGAEVVIVERPQGGDPARLFPQFHAAMNRNKRAVTLDLKTAAGRDGLRALLATADVLMEGYRPGTMQRLGFGYDDVARLRPGIVYVSITGFGQTGPYRDRPAHDLSYQAVAGMMYAQARQGGTALPGDVAIGDLSSGMFAALGTMAALIERARTGRGRHVDVSMTDGLVSWMSALLVPTMNAQPLPDVSSEPGYGVFRCGDGRLLTLSIAHEDWFWRPLCELLGLHDAAELGRTERIARATSLQEAITARLASAPRAEWAQRFDAAGIPWGPVHDLPEVAADPHFRERALFTDVTEADGTQRRYVAQPLMFDGLRPGPERGAPALGEGNAQLLA
jgi:crotonobetainyl-CoA:carnitine CoA-transferase CaiB-like acyl-CoA transferase